MTKNQNNFIDTNVTYDDTGSDMSLNKDVIFKKINVINGSQYNTSVLTSRIVATQNDPLALTSRTGDSKNHQI